MKLLINEINTPIGILTTICSNNAVLNVYFSEISKIIESFPTSTVYEIVDTNSASIFIKSYFNSNIKNPIPNFLLHTTNFRQNVLCKLSEVEFGNSVSYKELAILSNHPKAYRAVGSTCASNPIPIIIPCHRVLTSSGGIGGYAGGIEVKKALLDYENIPYR